MLRRLLWILGVPMLSLAQPVLPPTVCSASVTTNCVVVTSGAGAYIPVLPIASLAPIADQRVIGNVSGGSAAPVALTKAQTLTFLGGTTGSGTVVLSGTPTLATPVLGIANGTSLALGGATLGANALAVSGHLLLEGVTSTGATGTGNMVYDSTPTLITPAIGAATGTSLALGGATLGTNALAVTGHLLMEGVTSTGATGTGKFVFDSAPTLTGHPVIEGVTSTGATGTGNLVFSIAPTLTGLTTVTGVSASGGTAFTVSGCATVSAITGGATAGSFATTTTGTCTAVITLNGATGLTAPHGWACQAHDITAGHLATFSQTATAQTTCTISGATTSGDVIVFSATAY